MRIHRHMRHRDEESSHGIDLAPMLDFVLNLLIFFIITAVFVKEMGLMVNRPSGAVEAGGGGGGSTTIQILANGEIWIEGRVVDSRAVRANIERVRATAANKGVLILANEEAEAGLLVEVVDQVRLGGIYDITFATAE